MLPLAGSLYLYSCMKKSVALVMLITYSLFANGVVIRSHYCMNKLASRHLFGTKAESCGVCGMDSHNNNGCCSDELKVVKKYQDQQAPDKMLEDLQRVKAVFVIADAYFTSPLIQTEQAVETPNHSPPPILYEEIFKVIRVFRI